MLDYFLNVGILLCINACLAMTLNFVMGYAGIFSMAHALFFGIGAYAAAYVAVHLSASLLVVVPIVLAIAAVLSLFLSLPALRVRGEYFIAASLGLQMLGITVFTEWKAVTGGLGGVIDIPPPSIFGNEVRGLMPMFMLALGWLLVILAMSRALTSTSFGRNLRAIRDSESAASAAGKQVAAIKTLAVMFSSSLASVAGAIYAFFLSFINVESFALDTSVLLMAMVVIGGTGSFLGPLAGAAILMFLPMLFSYIPHLPATEVGAVQQIAYGAAMVLLMIFRPGGLVGSREGGKR